MLYLILTLLYIWLLRSQNTIYQLVPLSWIVVSTSRPQMVVYMIWMKHLPMDICNWTVVRIINQVVFHLILTVCIFCIIWAIVSVLIRKLNPPTNRSLKPVYNDVSNVVDIFEWTRKFRNILQSVNFGSSCESPSPFFPRASNNYMQLLQGRQILHTQGFS